MSYTEFVGASDASDFVYDQTKYVSRPGSPTFSVTLDDNGLFSSMVVPSGVDNWQKNVMRSWAAMLQANTAEIKKGEKGFVSREVN